MIGVIHNKIKQANSIDIVHCDAQRIQESTSESNNIRMLTLHHAVKLPLKDLREMRSRRLRKHKPSGDLWMQLLFQSIALKPIFFLLDSPPRIQQRNHQYRSSSRLCSSRTVFVQVLLETTRINKHLSETPYLHNFVIILMHFRHSSSFAGSSVKNKIPEEPEQDRPNGNNH